MSLESYSSSSTNRLKSCCFLINFFEKVLYLAELDAREYYGIVIAKHCDSSSKMHGYVRHEFLLFSYSLLQPHREVIPAFICSWTSRLLNDVLCAHQSLVVPQFYPFWTDTDPRQLLFYHLPFLVLAPSSSLTSLEKVLKSICSLLFHILSWSSCSKYLKSYSWQHWTPRFMLSSDRTGRI